MLYTRYEYTQRVAVTNDECNSVLDSEQSVQGFVSCALMHPIGSLTVETSTAIEGVAWPRKPEKHGG